MNFITGRLTFRGNSGLYVQKYFQFPLNLFTRISHQRINHTHSLLTTKNNHSFPLFYKKPSCILINDDPYYTLLMSSCRQIIRSTITRNGCSSKGYCLLRLGTVTMATENVIQRVFLLTTVTYIHLVLNCSSML